MPSQQRLSPVQLVESLAKYKHCGKNILQFNYAGNMFQNQIRLLENVWFQELSIPSARKVDRSLEGEEGFKNQSVF